MSLSNLPIFPALYDAKDFTSLAAVMMQELEDANDSTGEYEYLTVKEASKRFRDFTSQATCGAIAMLARVEQKAREQNDQSPQAQD